MIGCDLNDLPLLDHHCHPIRRHALGRLSPEEWAAFFTESRDPLQTAEHTPKTLFFRQAIRDLAAFWGCAPEAEAVLAARAAVGEAGVRRLLADARLEGLYLDTGFAAAESLSPAEMAALAPCPVRTILRLETLLEALIPAAADWEELRERFLEQVGRAPQEGHVALKSIVAYRGGLKIGDPSEEEAAAGFAAACDAWQRTGSLRLTERRLLHYCLRRALTVAAQIGLPVQFHTGFGDADADLRAANPLHLRPLLEDTRYSGTTFVLLHAGYPYVRETAHLAALYTNVYLDTSLAIPLVGPFAAQVWREALSLAPISKLMAATDAFGLPEHYWLAAQWSRRSLARVLTELVAEGALDEAEARAAAAAILAGNARRLYRA